jgi:predicted DNA-binding WGR domain protein
MKKESLHSTQGGSDKVYIVHLDHYASGYSVSADHGRRGAKLTHIEKRKGIVTLGEAEKVFNQLVASKLKKGYVSIGVTNTQTGTATPVQPQPVPTPQSAPNPVPDPALNMSLNNYRGTAAGW